jgi:uncharacterized protein YbjT (DUF2867 family)
VEAGWQVRGTSREAEALDRIQRAGLEPARADPDRVGTVLELVEDVAVVVWCLGSAAGPEELVVAVNGDRLERMLERLVDTPVRGFVYEASGSAPEITLAAGAALVRDASARWRIPVAVVEEPPADHEAWVAAMADAANRLIGLG